MNAHTGFGLRRFLRNLAVLTIVGGFLLFTLGPLVAIGLAGLVHDEAPDWYNEKLAEWLGLGCTMEYSLSEEDVAKLKAAGMDASAAANALAAASWCSSRFSTQIDIGILLAIYQKEAGGGSNYGTCNGLEAAINFGYNQAYYALRLLSHWERYDVRARNSVAAAYIQPDYNGYTGHCSAGEVGSGFIPRTAYKICTEGFSNSGDSDLKACDFWSDKGNLFGISYWLYRIGYRSDLSYDEKLDELYDWNHLLSYRRDLLELASQYQSSMSGVGPVSSSIFGESTEPGESFLGDLRLAIIDILDGVGLLPEVAGWLEAPLYPNADGGYTISQNWLDPTGNKHDGHPGIDYVCSVGADIIAVAPGEVVSPSGGIGVDPGWGKVIWIHHGGGIYTVYAHLSKTKVSKGEVVQQGQVIGECGNTGNSTGPHVHFGVANLDPNEFVKYRQYDPGWVDPNLFLGTCGVIED